MLYKNINVVRDTGNWEIVPTKKVKGHSCAMLSLGPDWNSDQGKKIHIIIKGHCQGRLRKPTGAWVKTLYPCCFPVVYCDCVREKPSGGLRAPQFPHSLNGLRKMHFMCCIENISEIKWIRYNVKNQWIRIQLLQFFYKLETSTKEWPLCSKHVKC